MRLLRIMNAIDNKTYGELLTATLPRKIDSEAENERVLGVIKSLMRKGEENLSPEEETLLDLLSGLVEDFEEEAYPMGNAATPLEALRSLVEEHGLRQIDLVDIFGSQGIVSEVLSGKRGISLTAAKKLANKFKLSVEVFV